MEDTFELLMITWVGMSLSLVCLLTCILTFACCRSIQNTRNTIHLHLSLSLFIASIIFLAGISRTEYQVMAFNDCSTSPLDMVPSQDCSISPSVIHNHSLNTTPSSAYTPPAYGMSCLSMSLGVISNLTGLAVLARSYTRFCGRAKAPFVLLAGALLLTDLAGQVTLGAFSLYLHLEQRRGQRALVQYFKPARAFCKLFGACMVFFGLCPLLLGSAMAVERCMGITQPFLHATVATVGHVRLSVLLLVSLAVSLATLPLLTVGGYVPQYPGTWCFLPVHGQLSLAHAGLVLSFSGFELAALFLSVLCNTVSGGVLLQARWTSWRARHGTGKHRGPVSASPAIHSLDVEMMTQLAMINVVSCLCWCPFLICVSSSVGKFLAGSPPSYPIRKHEQELLLSLRLASWNQILDPWVYILLRRAVLRRICCRLQPDKLTLTQNSSNTGSHRK
ncbi:prostaglandin E receptor 1c (subtype EP1) [Clupea harengus]|uniref:Thromboxane A2 receptor n=1 Tax=Clupea harengus TaxID=7950 RepID=A0A6P8FY68_CLUHA|nr:prostaglandin E receptor 1c (subtype EP1) [Clupea harengus]